MALQCLRGRLNADVLLLSVSIAGGLSAIAIAHDFFVDATPVAAWFVWVAIVDAATVLVLSAMALKAVEEG